jgi:hypothetical protein
MGFALPDTSQDLDVRGEGLDAPKFLSSASAAVFVHFRIGRPRDPENHKLPALSRVVIDRQSIRRKGWPLGEAGDGGD